MLVLLLPFGVTQAASCDIKPSAPPFIEHDLSNNVTTSNSWCELCGYGYVSIVISNPYSGASMTGLTVTESLGSSGLTYAPTAPTPMRYSVNGGGLVAGGAPAISGVNGRTLTWTTTQIPALATLNSSPGNGSNDTITIVVAVARAAGLSQEGLISAARTIQANVTFGTTTGTDPACTDSPQSTPLDTLPLREPIPNVAKTGWNYDAGQRQGSATTTIYGNNYDDVVWRIRFGNTGLAGLQDLRFDDLMSAGNLVINYACPTQASADAVAANNGTPPGGSPCIAASNSISNFIVTNPFGAMGTAWDGYEVDVSANSNASVYLVGKITSNGSCITSQTNVVSNVQWGCTADAPAGGITTTSTGSSLSNVTARLYTQYGDPGVTAALTVDRQITGVNTAQPVGSRGLVTITITNNTGGTVRNLNLTDVLPAQYVIDPTYWTAGFTKTLQVSTGAVYGVNTISPRFTSAYQGMIDTITWTNPAPNTLSTTNPAGPLGNVGQPLTFSLTSTTSNPAEPAQQHMLRHGDVLRVTFPIVLIESTYYDKVANLDVAPEVTSDGTDPTNQVTLTNTLTVDFDTLCTTQLHQTLTLTGNGTATNGSAIPAFPEDLDVGIPGAVFILTNNPLQPLTLPVALTNNGGHDARDYLLYVSFGATMEVQTAPSGCTKISEYGATDPLTPWRTWTKPSPIPTSATVYRCVTPAVITPGQTVTYNFTVIKTTNSARLTLDDLSFRADVIGEIRLWNTTGLWFPTPTARTDGQTDLYNNYSLDGVRARVIGFNLLKSRTSPGYCTENNTPLPALPDLMVQIGEECSFHIDTGGWFGFLTPGFSVIAVQAIKVVDELPSGQGYVSSTNPNPPVSSPSITGISLNPATLAPLDEGWIDWTFNQVVPAERITTKDEWFRVDMTSRLMNNPIDTVAAPNQHAALSTNVLNSYFQAVFRNDITMVDETFNLGPSTLGYPRPQERTIALTVTEPRLLITKEVCNETLYGVGPTCSNFVPLANDGDARNSYIYRIRVTNEAASSGVARAPAYDVIVTDTLDPSDLAYVIPFAGDGLDNDADSLTDAADVNGEGTISDNVVKNGTPAKLTFSYTHSTALQRINAGQSVNLYYRVDFDDDAAPLQQFVNIASASYDSLAGPSGNQSAPQKPNSDKGGARVYTSATATSTVQIIPVVTQPKTITRRSNTPLSGTSPQPVSIGEEVEYQIVTSLPVALLRNFVVRDELPAGIRCSEAPVINLNAAPYSAAGFSPGGTFTPTCTNNLVQWNFGNQRVTQGTTNNRYDFAIRFIARVDNIAGNANGTVIRNGGTSTNVTASYVDQSGASVVLTVGEAAIVVREPVIALTKAFSVANADASDVLTVTVTATNTGTATAYGLRVLDDLAAVAHLTYLGNVSGTDPPDAVDTTTLGANRPIFSWNPANPKFAIAPTVTRSFTFQVRVDPGVQPLEILDNTVQARWTSLPGQTTALNSTGLIGADGSIDGMRIGALPNAGDPVNHYETTATASATVPAISVTKTDLSPGVVPTIGAYKQFQIDIRLPEGVSNSVSVSDVLDASGISYVLVNNSTYPITYTFQGISKINDAAPPGAGLFTSLPIIPSAGATGTATWNIGKVETLTENDTVSNSVNPLIRISYYARVRNDLATNAGNTLRNSADVSYRHGETGATQATSALAPAVTVVEPLLTLGKTVTNITSPGNSPVVGDTLEYKVTLTNAGTATAFDINIVDTPPTSVVRDTSFTTTASINTVAVTGFVPTPTVAGVTLVWGRGNGDGSLDVPVGETLMLTYRVIVQTIPGPAGVIENGVTADWTSLEGDPGNDTNNVSIERTGAGCPAFTAPNDYCVGPVKATTTGVQPLRFEKTVFNVTTGQAQPPSPTLLTANPGDLLRYTLRLQNTSNRPLSGLKLTDELDRLNATAMFQSLIVPITITGSGTDFSSATGGAKGSGLVDVRNINLAAAGGADTVTIVFETRLKFVIPNGIVVPDQAQLFIATGSFLANSDDPILNGAENPGIVGDEDPTSVKVAAAPFFDVRKTVTDLTGSPTIHDPGDTLRYTITIKNTGTENATGTTFRDLIPANSTYVAGSATLNGAPVPDPAPGVSPFENNFIIHAPEDPTPGAMRADASVTTTNVATVTFRVVISASALNGTLISNQGFVNGLGTDGSGNARPVPEEPSDDPATAAVNDPTVVVVGDMPFLYTHKTVALLVDNGTPGQVDPGDVLRYTFTTTNFGPLPATGVTLTDNLPNNTTYVANSFQLNGLAVAGAFPPSQPGGVPISSADRTPPLPVAGAGTLSAGASAVSIFDAQVTAGTPSGTIISNQGTVTSNELTPQLTDADGNPANGFQPTQIVVGNAQRLVITKQVAVVGGGPAIVGAVLEYVVQVRNISTVDAKTVVITDNLPTSLQFTLSYVAGSGTLNGSAAGVTMGAVSISANYATTYGNLPAGATAELRYRVNIDSGTIGATITNTATVTWDTPTQSATASASIIIGGVFGNALLTGTVWHDANFNNTLDPTELVLAGWSVQVYRYDINPPSTRVLIGTVITDASGVYKVSVPPNAGTALRYELRFLAPGAGVNTAKLGLADSASTVPVPPAPPGTLPFTDSLQQISNIQVAAAYVPDLNLPIDPDGVIYNSILRSPVVGATLTLLQASTQTRVPDSCFIVDSDQQDQVTLRQGYYKFDLNFSDPACPPGGADYLIRVVPPATGYGSVFPSALIPPATSATTAAYSVATCPADAIATPVGFCEAQASEFAPPTSVPPQSAGTVYYLKLHLDNGSIPGHSQLFNNHIPLDPDLSAAIAISKTSPLVNVTRGQLVPYMITVKNTLGAALPYLSIVDTFPPGFKYVVGSAQFDGVPTEPTKTTRQLSWDNLTLASDAQHTIKLLLIVGAGVADTEYVNRAQVINTATSGPASAVATATVRVTPDPTFDCTDIIGKVFDDVNADGHQDRNEPGLAGVRVVSARGLIATTDKYGRYHITCAVVPNEDRGSNFILKLDDHSLPTGYRVTTENPLVLRATRGKMMKFNFGATLHRVVRLDISDAVFEPGTTDMRPQWQPRTGILLDELRKAPSILRISYLADVEDAALVTRRLQSVKRDVIGKWKAQNRAYELRVETEIYWRRGGPPDRKVLSR